MSGDNETAFRQIYNRYAARVYTLSLVYLKSPVVSQDMVQEVFLKIWVKRKELSGIQNFGGWLQVVTRNTIISQIRKKIPEDASFINDVPGAISPEEQYVNKETAVMVREAIQRLSTRQQEVYRMAREEGLQRAEIARQLNVSTETVKEHMSQALKNIRSYLSENLGLLLLMLLHQ